MMRYLSTKRYLGAALYASPHSHLFTFFPGPSPTPQVVPDGDVELLAGERAVDLARCARLVGKCLETRARWGQGLPRAALPEPLNPPHPPRAQY